jgi:hypothetical protein
LQRRATTRSTPNARWSGASAIAATVTEQLAFVTSAPAHPRDACWPASNATCGQFTSGMRSGTSAAMR